LTKIEHAASRLLTRQDSCDWTRLDSVGVYAPLLWTVRSTKQRDQAEHSSADAMLLTALGPQLHQPRAATIHRGPPARFSRASKRYISTRIPSFVADRTPLVWTADSCPPLRCNQHRWGEPNNRRKN